MVYLRVSSHIAECAKMKIYDLILNSTIIESNHQVILAETLSPTFVGFTFQVRTIKMAVTNQTNLAIL